MSVRRVRPILKRVFVDEVEERLICENMAKFGMLRFSTYARRVLLFPTVPIIQVDLSTYEQVLYELRRIGNNVNQIAKAANQSKDIAPSQVEQLEGIVSELADKFRNELELKIKELENQYGSDKT
ncbi:MobC family plasmid mobilization relaxosome protein [Streptococcus suis]|uniref:MobC family plasmid mobilization relaxosome protein n=1 Tax=Streptococcus suis TaxID=1307 RepID=UPI0010AA928B|nr:MobC family plasmid mobilization relaxosome protein [Streptococcus suis]MBM7317936.1 MobC family plasmid mobilization relaxosome protein [Streptococcus suis]MBY4963541.1 MobC family plasmid mobilization relaxosome protein [Streptococcus suis]TII10979.1 MobC family plasmid mobilization relaxosome protein [Streptococcus suis]